ncbi:phage tail protein [Solibacillus sp. FSL K6-1523]|uniref:phage tail protein n=1 Tax=Solibacillus sp. FSL K6-1523 TaxID=2921471 RepID=UPI0030FA7FDA
MAQYGTIITNIGLAQIANAQVTQTKVGLDYIALGDGNGAHYVPSQSQTSLVREVWRGPIAELSIDPTNNNRIIIDAVIPVTAGGFTIREIGIFDDKNQLIAVGQYPEKYKPELSEGVSEETLIHFVIETNNADVVKLTIDPTVIIASRKYVDEKVAGINKGLTEITRTVTELESEFTTHKEDDKRHTSMLNFMLNSAMPSEYPEGVSLHVAGSSDNTAGYPSPYGLVVTFKYGTIRSRQVFYESLTSMAWTRSYDLNKVAWLDWVADTNEIIVYSGKLEDVKVSGTYYCHGATSDKPTNHSYFVESYVYDPAANYIKLVAYAVTGNAEISSLMYTKAKVNGVWQQWVKVLNQYDYDALFQSVSNGKSQVANAITQKGVPTASNAEFATMATNIGKIETNSTVSGTGTSYVSGYDTVFNITGLPFRPRAVIIKFNNFKGKLVFNNDWGISDADSFALDREDGNTGGWQNWSTSASINSNGVIFRVGNDDFVTSFSYIAVK